MLMISIYLSFSYISRHHRRYIPANVILLCSTSESTFHGESGKITAGREREKTANSSDSVVGHNISTKVILL